MGGSSSQPRTDPAMSPVNAFPIEELYTPEFSDSFQENTGYWQEHNPHESPTPWTAEEEIALAKGWLAVSENSKHGNARRQAGFWCEVLQYMESKTKQYSRRTYDMVCEKWKTVRPSVIRFCGIYNNVMRMTQESRAGDEDYEIRQSRGRDKARVAGKNERSKASGSSTVNEDALARLMVTEMTAQENEQREKFLEIKRREVKCREREIATQEYRQEQEDMRFYLQPYDLT
ncbi:hypothetical protein Tco_0210762 [Tanacetum coccineum]